MNLGTFLSLSALRRRWPLLLVALLIGAGLGLARTETTTPKYSSSTAVFFSLNRTSTVGELAQGTAYLQGLVQSFADVATSRLVLGPVADQMGLAGDSPLARSVDAKPRPNTAILDITVVDTSPTRAAHVADLVASQLSRTVPKLSPRSDARAATVSVTALSPAAVPTQPIAPNPRLNLALGLILGLVLGLGAIAVVEAVTAPVTSRDSAVAATSAPVLAMIPADRRRRRPAVALQEPRSARSEAFWMLRTTLQLQRPSAHAPLCLVVVSPRRGDGRTSTAVNLAIAMSHTAHRVLLMDGDLRRPSIADLLDLDGSHGVSTVLAGLSDIDSALQVWSGPGAQGARVDVLCAGALPASPSEMLASEGADKLMDLVRARYDVVVVDSAPLLEVPDGAVLAAKCDGALLVVNGRRTRSSQLSEAVTRLQLAGVTILGVAMNRTRPERVGSYRRSRPSLRRDRSA
jgi:capsular exopolysaccharide synthesis family protein